MNISKPLLGLLSASLLWSACAKKLPIYYSKPMATVSASAIATDGYYDSASEIRYTFSHNDTLLVVMLETSKDATQVKMMRSGVKIYLSPSQRKDERTYLQYPVSAIEPPMSRDEMKANGEKPSDKPQPPKNNAERAKKMLARLSKTALWVEKEQPASFRLGSANAQFWADLSIDEAGKMRYIAAIPRTKLRHNGGSDTLQVMGIEIAGLEMPSSPPDGGMPPMGGGMGGGGGMPPMGGGGMGGGGGMPPMGGDGAPPMGGGMPPQMQGAATSVEWWFKIKFEQ